MLPAKAPYYESRYIRANDPDRPQALWLRETLLLPTAGNPVADVWVMVFDPEGAGNRALKEPYPIDAANYEYDSWTARIGATTVDDRAAQGVVTGGNRSARWDLRITPGSEEPVKLLTERAYNARFPTAKTTVRHPLAQFDGRLELDDSARGRRLERKRQPQLGHPTHTGLRVRPSVRLRQRAGIKPGDRHRARKDRASIAPRGHAVRLPPRQGEFAVRSILGSLHTHSRYRPFSWTFGGRVGERMIEGEIFTEPADVIGLTYTDTDGGSKYCYNSAIATCRIQLAGKAFERTELVATRRAMFEILTDTRHEAVPLLA